MTAALLRRARPLLGTIVEVTAHAADDVIAQRAIAAAFSAVERVQRAMSCHDAASELSRLNATAHVAAVRVSAPLWQVLRLAQRLARESDGAFDVTVAPRLAAWGFLPRTSGADQRATFRDITLESGRRVRFRRPLRIDLGGIAKGFAVDRAVAALRRAGATAGCVNAGGDLRVFGPDPWPIYIRHPQNPGAMAATLPLENAALATSATYFSRRRSRGQVVSALIDGRTRAAITSAHSVTICAPRAILADALTKIVLARGDAAAPLLARYGASALVLDRSHAAFRSLAAAISV